MKLKNQEMDNILSKLSSSLQEDKGMDAEVAVMYRNPRGRGIWFITGADMLSSGDYLLFGYSDLYPLRWGSMLFSQLEDMVTKVGLERVIFTDKYPTVSELVCKYGIARRRRP